MLHHWYTVINYSSPVVRFSLFTLWTRDILLQFIYFCLFDMQRLGTTEYLHDQRAKMLFPISILKHVHGINGPMTSSNLEVTFRTLLSNGGSAMETTHTCVSTHQFPHKLLMDTSQRHHFLQYGPLYSIHCQNYLKYVVMK